MKPTWIVQKNLVSELHRWITALEECQSKYELIEIIPFADELPKIEVEGPSIVYGSTTLIKNAPKYGYGTFFNEDNFRPSLWNIKYGHNMFNYDGVAMKLGELDPGSECFVRPDSDMKDFSGSIVDFAGWLKFREGVERGEYPFGLDLPIFASKVKPIYKEYRVFIVDGGSDGYGPVAWSQYKLRTMLDKKEYVPRKVLQFARQMAKIWSPEKAFVMDICSDNNEKLHILELNCFNASGVYCCDVPSIVRDVEKLFL